MCSLSLVVAAFALSRLATFVSRPLPLLLRLTRTLRLHEGVLSALLSVLPDSF